MKQKTADKIKYVMERVTEFIKKVDIQVNFEIEPFRKYTIKELYKNNKTQLKCDCGKPDCLAINKKKYCSFINKSNDLAYDMKKNSNREFLCEISHKFCIKIDPTYSKCKMLIINKDTQDTMMLMHKYILILEGEAQAYTDFLNLQQSCLEEALISFNNNRYEIDKLKNKILKKDEIIKSIRDENKILNDKLLKETLIEIDDTTTDSSDEDIEINEIDLTNEKIIENYQKLVNYMIVNKKPLKEIIPNKRLRDKFFELQTKRNEIAHPQTNSINDDAEFINILQNL